MHCYSQMRFQRKKVNLAFWNSLFKYNFLLWKLSNTYSSKERSIMIPWLQQLSTFHHLYFILASLIAILICFFFRGWIWNQIPGIVYFHCTLFSMYLHRKSLWKNYDHKVRIIYFLFYFLKNSWVTVLCYMYIYFFHCGLS